MTRTYLPRMGYPATEYLTKLEEDIREANGADLDEGTRSRREMGSICRTVRGALNDDVCLHDGQAELVESRIVNDSREQAELEDALIGLIHTFRHECDHCLNDDCEWRAEETSALENRRVIEPQLRKISSDSRLSIRSYNILGQARLRVSMNKLAELTETEILRRVHGQQDVVDEVKSILDDYGLQLRDEAAESEGSEVL